MQSDFERLLNRFEQLITEYVQHPSAKVLASYDETRARLVAMQPVEGRLTALETTVANLDGDIRKILKAFHEPG